MAYTDSEVVWVGVTEAEAAGVEYSKGGFWRAPSGRSLSLGGDGGFSKMLLDKATDRVLCAGVVGVCVFAP